MAGPARVMSTFDGLPLLTSLPFSPTFYQGLLFDDAASARLRGVIDRWVESQPAAARPELIQRLRHQDGCLPAFFELATGAILALVGTDVEKEPVGLPCRGKPDYAARLNGLRTVLEVATVESVARDVEDRREQIVERLRSIHGPWWIGILWSESTGIEKSHLKELERVVRQALEDLTEATGQKVVIPIREARLAMLVWPAKRADKSIIGIGQARGRTSPGLAQIRGAIDHKAYKYHDLKDAGLPFIQVICTADHFIDSESFFDAVFGDETVPLVFADDEVIEIGEPVLNDAGSFTPMSSGRLVNTTVSAAWFVELTSIDPITVRVLQATNPWARNALTWQDPRVASVEQRDTTTRKEFRLPTDRPSIRLA